MFNFHISNSLCFLGSGEKYVTTIQAMMVQLVLAATNHRRTNRTRKKKGLSASNSLNKSIPRRNDSSWRGGICYSPSNSGLVLVLAGRVITFWGTSDHMAQCSAYEAGVRRKGECSQWWCLSSQLLVGYNGALQNNCLPGLQLGCHELIPSLALLVCTDFVLPIELNPWAFSLLFLWFFPYPTPGSEYLCRARLLLGLNHSGCSSPALARVLAELS